jgi:hypothetical protein
MTDITLIRDYAHAELHVLNTWLDKQKRSLEAPRPVELAVRLRIKEIEGVLASLSVKEVGDEREIF